MLAMTSASILFVFSDTLAKLAAQHWPVAQVLVTRSIFAIALLLVVIRSFGDGPKLRPLFEPIIIVRSIVEAGLALIFVSALALMPLADLTTILMLAPLAITAFANIFLGEVVGWRRWSAIIVGFLGLLLVVQPGSKATAAPGYMLGASFALISVVLVAARDIITKRVQGDIPSTVIALGTTLATMAGAIALSGIESWRAFSWVPLIYVALAALIVTAGNLLLVISCRGADLSVVAPFRYTAVLWSITIGYFAFGDLPNAVAIAGMGVIVASGIYLMHRERVRAKEASLPK